MDKIQDYLSKGSSNSPPGEAFQALDIVLKNRPFSLRLVNMIIDYNMANKNAQITAARCMEISL